MNLDAGIAITTLINMSLIGAAVVIHYEVLKWLSRLMPHLFVKHRTRIVFGVFGALAAHTLEIWLFALGYYLMINVGGHGQLLGNFSNTLLDCVYFSFTTYTTLGFGDIEPLGHIRFLVGLEALTGLVLITWTASFLFIEMSQNWEE